MVATDFTSPLMRTTTGGNHHGFTSKFSIRSPSVPNLRQQLYSETNNYSAPAIEGIPNNKDAINDQRSNSEEYGGSLSVIDLYDDNDSESPQKKSTRSITGLEDFQKDVGELNSMSADHSNDDLRRSNSITIDINENEHTDRYGFKKQSTFISEADYNSWWNDYSKYCVRRKFKWKLLLEKGGLPVDNDSPTRFPSKSEKLKRYVRKGIPAEWRGDAWWYFARGQEKLNRHKGVYDTLLVKVNKITEQKDHDNVFTDLEIIERDLNRTFPDNIHFQKQSPQDEEPELIKSLRRVLVAFSLYNPKIGYCQSMNFIAGLLLLFLDEERAFWMLVIITSRYLPGVHDVNLEGVNIDQGVLMLCVKEYLPEIWSYIAPITNKKGASNNRRTTSSTSRKNRSLIIKNEFLYRLPPITLCTASWFMSCFIGILPIETTLRVWDCMFYEESHFLFKISLSILKLSENDLLRHKKHRHGGGILSYGIKGGNSSNTSLGSSNDAASEDGDMEIFQIIQTFPKKLLNPNDIFDKVIFKRKYSFNRLDQDEVDRCRKYVSSQRTKYKHYIDTVEKQEIRGIDKSTNHIGEKENILTSEMDEDTINEALSSEVYGFKRNLTGVHWNNSLKAKVRQMKKKIDREV
ncbi:hypothetical protein NCAS_0A09920 [Naumovozyma castellii]|uniref:Rab-GAP TBC domain-containing protein n=1 Tax=Naumovozyma castellii TaxID=27288 RepID=G0V7V2_NAUCA|nr:hypothetical protein NCAS_0A09920 [Naumovozyma castellii CBS 4309]CCC67550.1 hypothetical protein NCAS_0A09920 [Naumovozyma castellii CBS 4309]